MLPPLKQCWALQAGGVEQINNINLSYSVTLPLVDHQLFVRGSVHRLTYLAILILVFTICVPKCLPDQS